MSSTYVDLMEERQEVIQTLLEADCIPAGMELFPASDEDRWTLIKRVIDDSDYYIVVVGGRYGSVDPDKGLSFTEMEFDYAVSTKTPVMGFLHGAPGDIPQAKSDLDQEAREHLEAFRVKVGKRIVKHWTSPHELGGQVAKSLMQIRKTHPAEGWVRARHALTPEVETEIAELRAQVAELTTELEKTKTVPPVSPESLAQADDIHVMQVAVSYIANGTDESGQPLPSYRPRRRFVSQCTASWDEIFARLGPLMMDEASEAKLEEELDRLVDRFWRKQGHETPRDFSRASSVVTVRDEIQTVKIQLFSLGLVDQSIRRRAVTDKETYWTNTQLGRDHLMRLRAIRRPDTAGGGARDGDTEEEEEEEE